MYTVFTFFCINSQLNKDSFYARGLVPRMKRALADLEAPSIVIRRVCALVKVLSADDDRREGVSPNTFQRCVQVIRSQIYLVNCGPCLPALLVESFTHGFPKSVLSYTSCACGLYRVFAVLAKLRTTGRHCCLCSLQSRTTSRTPQLPATCASP